MQTLSELNQALETLLTELVSVQSEIDSYDVESNHDLYDLYDEMLDECQGEFMGYNASYILKNVDEIAYNLGYSEFCDSIEPSDFREYQELEQRAEELQCDIEEIEEEISILEDEELTQ